MKAIEHDAAMARGNPNYTVEDQERSIIDRGNILILCDSAERAATELLKLGKTRDALSLLRTVLLVRE